MKDDFVIFNGEYERDWAIVGLNVECEILCVVFLELVLFEIMDDFCSEFVEVDIKELVEWEALFTLVSITEDMVTGR